MTRTRLLAGLAGLAFAACAASIAWCGAAGGELIGEGWSRPLYHSPLLFIVYPIVFIRLAEADRTASRFDFLLLAVAAVADLAFLVQSLGDAHEQQGGIPVAFWPWFWLIFWLFWQMLVILTVLTRRSARHRTVMRTGKKAAAILLGLILAAVAQSFAFVLAWGGEGWNGPFIVSLPLFLIYPAVLSRLAHRGHGSAWVEMLLLILGAALNAFLIWDSLALEEYYFRSVWNGGAADLFLNIWLLLWVLWPMAILVNIASQLLRVPDDAGWAENADSDQVY